MNFRLRYSLDRGIEFELINQLEIGDRITVKLPTTYPNTWEIINTTVFKQVNIIGFKHEDDPYPISVMYDDDPTKYDIPLKWIVIDESTLRDIKLNRVLC